MGDSSRGKLKGRLSSLAISLALDNPTGVYGAPHMLDHEKVKISESSSSTDQGYWTLMSSAKIA